MGGLKDRINLKYFTEKSKNLNKELNKIVDNIYQLFVSVIIPVFNDSKRLALCLEALQNQTGCVAKLGEDRNP